MNSESNQCAASPGDPLAELQARGEHRFRLTVGDLLVVLEHLGCPHLGRRSVLIAGTNGKGSTAAVTDSILRAAGQRVGRYTSPHLLRVNERISIGGKALSDLALRSALQQVIDAETAIAPRQLTFFELLTAAAFCAFQAANIDVQVLEVGLGGRLDATCIVEPTVSVITNIGLDHEDILGKTRELIAVEKAGVIRGNVPLLTAVDDRLFHAVIGPTCAALDATAKRYTVDFQMTRAEHGWHYRTVDLEFAGLPVELHGDHQLSNIALGISAAHQITPITEHEVQRGLRDVRWPARLQWIDGQPPTLLDVAHNPASARALAAYLRHRSLNDLVLLVGVRANKDWREILQPFRGLAKRSVITTLPIAGSADPQVVRDWLTEHVGPSADIANVGDALQYARELCADGRTLVIFGSHYLIAELARFDSQIRSAVNVC